MLRVCTALFLASSSLVFGSESTALSEQEIAELRSVASQVEQALVSDHLADASTAPAQETPPPEAPSTMEKVSEVLKSHLQIGGDYTWVQISPKGLLSTTGSLGGLQGQYEYKAPYEVYGALVLSWKEGNTKNHAGERSLCYVDLQERLGYTLGMSDSWSLALFTGLGYRYHGEKVSTSTDSIQLAYNELYIPVGFSLEGQMHSWMSWGLNFEWMPQVYPTLTIDPLKGARWIITNQLANFRVGTPINFTFLQRPHLFISVEPFFEYWRDGRTTAKTESGFDLGVPGNTYLFGGINVNFGYSF